MSEPITVLLNRKAGAAQARSFAGELCRMAKDAELDIIIAETTGEADFRAKINAHVKRGARSVCVAGGDGTVGIAAQELANTQTALGILSLGTFNNFATCLRLPHNLPAALRVIAKGDVREVDLGKIGNRYFTESVGIGLFADGLSLYGHGRNNSLPRGIKALLGLWLTFRPHSVTLDIDGKTYRERVTACEICNTYRIYQAIPIAPEADMHDGLLDVALFVDVRRSEIAEYIQAIRSQVHQGLPKVKIIKAKRVVIESADRRTQVHAGDMLIGNAPQTIEVARGALRVIVDEDYA